MLLLADDPETSGILGYLIEFFWWLINLICNMMYPLIEWMVGLIPEAWSEGLGTQVGNFSPWLAIVNNWVPLDWAFSLFAAWLIFQTAFITVKLMLKVLRGA